MPRPRDRAADRPGHQVDADGPPPAWPDAAGAAQVVRVGDPAALVDAVPHLVGFVPGESLVLMSLRGPRRRVGLVLRADLPDLLADREGVPRLVELLVRDGAAAVAAIVWTATGHHDGLPHQPLTTALRTELGRAGLTLLDLLCVDGRRLWSYECDGDCCPPAGQPLATPGCSELAAASALLGQVVLADRADLARRLAPPPGPQAHAIRARLAAADRRHAGAPGRPGSRDATAAALLFRQLLTSRRAPGDDETVLLLSALQDPVVRDGVAMQVPDERLADATDLLCALLRRSVTRWDVAPATLLAVLAWRRGSGALANLALERAFASDPQCRLARYVEAALHAGLRPGPEFGQPADGDGQQDPC